MRARHSLAFQNLKQRIKRSLIADWLMPETQMGLESLKSHTHSTNVSKLQCSNQVMSNYASVSDEERRFSQGRGQ
jgi:hypothetical protein